VYFYRKLLLIWGNPLQEKLEHLQKLFTMRFDYLHMQGTNPLQKRKRSEEQ